MILCYHGTSFDIEEREVKNESISDVLFFVIVCIYRKWE